VVFVRYIHNKTIEEDFLFCRPLETTTKACDVLKLVEDFFTAKKLNWNKLGSVCTDRAPAMLGVRSGFLTFVKEKNPKVIGTHCIIHREALASRTMSQPLKQALDCAKVVNYIKASALNTRIFRKVCQDMDAGYDSLLLHTSVRWLSKGNMLIRHARLLPGVIEFLKIQHKQELKTDIAAVMFQNRLAFLADIFFHLNELNRNLQGVGAKILGLQDKIAAFFAKPKLWETKIQPGQRVAVFPMMNKMSETNGINSIIQSESVDHFNSLLEEFRRYFPGVEHDTPMVALNKEPF